jgi:hypothetical protein
MIAYGITSALPRFVCGTTKWLGRDYGRLLLSPKPTVVTVTSTKYTLSEKVNFSMPKNIAAPLKSTPPTVEIKLHAGEKEEEG